MARAALRARSATCSSTERVMFIANSSLSHMDFAHRIRAILFAAPGFVKRKSCPRRLGPILRARPAAAATSPMHNAKRAKRSNAPRARRSCTEFGPAPRGCYLGRATPPPASTTRPRQPGRRRPTARAAASARSSSLFLLSTVPPRPRPSSPAEFPQRSELRARAPWRCRRRKWVDDLKPGEHDAVLQIFRQQLRAAALNGGLNNECVVERKAARGM